MAKRVLIPYRHSTKVTPYLDAVRETGAEPVATSVSEPVTLDGMDGLLLMGGSDVNPRSYHAAVQPETETPDDERDQVELAAIKFAIDCDLPIFAICRGLQILNVYHRGTLIQHLTPVSGHDAVAVDKSTPAHEVIIEAGSRLGRIAKASTWRVNSRHHQATDSVGLGLSVSARATDGIIEGLERDDRRFVLAVQWHPEDQVRRFPEQKSLFESFADAL